MSLCRVYQNPDGTVRVVYPNPKHDPAEAFALTEASDPTLAGLPFADVAIDELPDRSTRSRWRMAGGALTVGAPDLDPAHVAAVQGKALADARRRELLEQIAAVKTLPEARAALAALATHTLGETP